MRRFRDVNVAPTGSGFLMQVHSFIPACTNRVGDATDCLFVWRSEIG